MNGITNLLFFYEEIGPIGYEIYKNISFSTNKVRCCDCGEFLNSKGFCLCSLNEVEE